MKKTIGILLTLTLLLSIVSIAFAKQDNGNGIGKGNGNGNGNNVAAVIQNSDQQRVEADQKKVETSQQKVETDQQISETSQQLNKKQLKSEQKAEKQAAKAEQKAAKAEQKQQQVAIKQAQKTVKQTFKINGSAVIKYGKYKLPIRPITKGLGAKLQFDKGTGVLTVSKDNTTIVIDFVNKTVTVNGVQDKDASIFTAINSKKTTVLIKYIANELGMRVKVDDNKIVTETPGSDASTATPATGSAITLNAN